MNFGFYTLGCKVNQFETQALEQIAVSRGHNLSSKDADVFIINTCTVTSISDHKNIRAIHKIKRENPNAIIAACGCFAQTNPEKLDKTDEIDIICGTDNRSAVIELCENAVNNRKRSIHVTDASIRKPFEELPAGILNGRTRGLLKVQDGCDNYCTYCIIPYARGHVRSMPMDDILRQAIALKDSGVSEIIVTGIEISSYGVDLEGNTNLLTLIDTICTMIPDVQIRLGSLEPRTITEDFCKILSKHKNLALHFHLSLQSGSDGVLKRMKRRYTTSEFYSFVHLLRKYFENPSITTDIIVGFPGETEEEFQETLDFVEKCKLSSVHVFPYSIRTGTVAASMPNQLDNETKNKRATMLKDACSALSHTFLSDFIGKNISVLLEHPSEDFWNGHSKWHFTVKVKTDNGQKNQKMLVKITEIQGDCLLGEEF